MTTTNVLGKYYWCVKVPKSISSTGELYVYADSIWFMENGALNAVRLVGEEQQLNLSLAHGAWISVYRADPGDGAPMACEHWPNEKTESGDLVQADGRTFLISQGAKDGRRGRRR
jgi:hypothetical protein